MMDLFIMLSSIAWPKKWNDLSAKELEHLIDLLIRDMSAESYLFSFGMYLLKNREAKIWRIVRRRYSMCGNMSTFSGDDSALLEFKSFFLLSVQERLGWILGEPNLTKAPYPILKGYRSLSDGCSDMCYLEYMCCESALKAFNEGRSGSKESLCALNELVCTIYAPVDVATGGRLWLRPSEEKQRTLVRKRLHKMPLRRKLLILYFFISCYSYIRSCFPEMFSPMQEESNCRNFGHAGLLIELAGDKFGTVDQTAESNIYTLFTHLEKEIIKYNEFKEKYNR